jgi:alpha-tubulin suppressor-like RCC1 family protein
MVQIRTVTHDGLEHYLDADSITMIAKLPGSVLLLLRDGTVWGSGDNTWGLLGIGTTVSSKVPIQVPGLHNIVAIAAGNYHCAALSVDGSVWTWGVTDFGECGTGLSTSNDRIMTPVRIAIRNVASLAAGHSHTLALDAGGSVWSWGLNIEGQLGLDLSDSATVLIAVMTDQGLAHQPIIPAPQQIPTLAGVTDVDAGMLHSVALLRDGTVQTWGSNSQGQLGHTELRQSFVPVAVPDLCGAVAVAAGDYHSLALTAEGTVWAWGANDRGQLGNGQTVDNPVPHPVRGLRDVVEIAGLVNGSGARCSDGTIWVWGHGRQGQASTAVPFAPNPLPVPVDNPELLATKGSLALRLQVLNHLKDQEVLIVGP